MSIYDKWFTDMTKAACEINFHDSSITAIDYDPNSFTTIVSVAFCNWAQPEYDKNEPDVITVYLYFHRSFLMVNPDIRFNDFSGDIYRAEYIDPRTIKFIIDTDDENESVQEIKIVAEELYFRRDKMPFDNYNCTIAESDHYAVVREYEDCYLMFKDMSRRSVSIGDFYGDAEFALIDRNERFVVMGGCGIIIYFLHEPWDMYTYDKKTPQWIELGRGESDMYYDAVNQIGDTLLEITDADGNTLEYDLSEYLE